MKRSIKKIGYSIIVFTIFFSCKNTKTFNISIFPTLEHKDAIGRLYTPSTQSLLRTYSVLEKAKSIQLKIKDEKEGEVKFQFPGNTNAQFQIKNLPLDQLVPRLHYTPSSPADEFDGLNLMLAEYSRNGLSFPYGKSGDIMSHFQTNLTDKVPWKLHGDFNFTPNENYRPLRMSVINNCLRPGLWELNAIDRSGEIYHVWFDMPLEEYYHIVSTTNGLTADFVQESLKWDTKKAVTVDLNRLREENGKPLEVKIEVINEKLGYSSQDSRRKSSKNFALCLVNDTLTKPIELKDFVENPVKMSSFIEPGIYDYKERSTFNFDFLAHPKKANIKKVVPKTSYNWQSGPTDISENSEYLEFEIVLSDQEKIIIGNLPCHLLVQQEDYLLPGFGVGILNASGLAERRKFLIQQGHAPSYAYLVKQENESILALNSHGRGIEQIFIRTYPYADIPYFELTITSYERIVDLVKYKIPIPLELQEILKTATNEYIPPIYLHYTDNNIN